MKSISFGSNLMVNERRIELNGRTRIAFSEKGLILTYIWAETRLGDGVDPDPELGGGLRGGCEGVNLFGKVGRCSHCKNKKHLIERPSNFSLKDQATSYRKIKLPLVERSGSVSSKVQTARR